MANDKNEPKKPQGAAGSRPKRPTTIDLRATEIRRAPEKETRPEPVKTEQPTSSTPPPPRPDETEATPSNPGPAADTAPPHDYLRGAYDRLPNWPWPVIGIAAAAAIVFFAVGLGAGQWMSGTVPQASLVS